MNALQDYLDTKMTQIRKKIGLADDATGDGDHGRALKHVTDALDLALDCIAELGAKQGAT